MAKQAAKATADTLAADDLLEVIAFDSQPTRIVRMTAAKHRARIQSDIARIQAGGGTEIFPALDAAYQALGVTRARKKHVILLTDGQAPQTGIRDLVQAMSAEAITVSTVGLGGRRRRRAPAHGRRRRRRALLQGGRSAVLAARLHQGDRDGEPVGRGRGVLPAEGRRPGGLPARHRHGDGAVPARLRGDEDEAPARAGDPRERARRAHPRALARGARLVVGVDERRQEPLGGRVVAVAGLRAVLGAARAGAHAPEAAPRVRLSGPRSTRPRGT